MAVIPHQRMQDFFSKKTESLSDEQLLKISFLKSERNTNIFIFHLKQRSKGALSKRTGQIYFIAEYLFQDKKLV